MQGVIKGLGLQVEASRLAGYCYFLVGLPAAWVLGLYFGVNGLWFGILIATVVLLKLYMRLLMEADWEGIMEKILESTSSLTDTTLDDSDSI